MNETPRPTPRTRHGPTRRHARRALVLVGALQMIVMGCSADGLARRGSEVADTGSAAGSAAVCALREVDRSHITLESGTAVYVEPQALVATENGFVLAGQPSYEWLVDPGGRATMRRSRAFLGVEVRDGRATPIEMPPGVGAVDWVRAVGDPAGRMAYLLQEVDRPEMGALEELRIVYAEREGDAWTRVETLPTPPTGRVELHAGSRLVAGRGAASVLWAALHFRERGGIDVLLYERRGTEWTISVAARDWADEVDIAFGPDGALRLAVGGLEPDFGGERASIRVSRRDEGVWQPMSRLDAGGPGERFRKPRFTLRDGVLDLAWIRTDDASVSQGWYAPDASRQGATPTLFARSALWLRSAEAVGHEPLFVTYHLDEVLGVGALRVTRSSGESFGPAVSIDYPFTGFFEAAMTPSGELLVVGPEALFDPTTPSVRSLLIRLSPSCT